MRRVIGAVRVIASICLLMLIAASAMPPAAHAEDPAAKRREVQRKRAAAAAEINVLKADDARVEAALDALQANLKSAENRASAARQAEAVATRQLEAAKQAETKAKAEVERSEAEMKAVAVQAYVNGPAASSSAGFGLDPNDAVRQRVLVDTVMGNSRDKVDALRSARDDLAEQRAAAAAAEESASKRAAEVRNALSTAKRAKDDQARIAAGVETRLERALAEADSLASIDRQLAAEIQQRQAALARKVQQPPAPRASRGAPAGRPGSVNTRSVRGIVVAEEIADNLEALLAAADQDGMSFGGSGYRNSDQQVATRRANCGSSDYDVYEKPASQCSPPTARPGQSMHERGLAVDFTYQGRLINGRSNPGFQWLSRNASRFGLYNLPAEPWHWSTNGN